MAAKSIVQVEIQDGAWKAFNKSVIRHQASLRQMPGQWGAVGSSIGKATNASAKFVATIAETSRQFKNANTAAGKMTLALKASDRVVSSLGRGTSTIARNLKDATKSLLGWLPIMGIFSGLLGAGGLFGIARMASSVSAGQASAMQAGTTYGGSKAAGIAYGQMLGGESGVMRLLNAFAVSQQSGGLMFQKLGMGAEQWKGKNTSDILPSFLKALQEMQKQAPEGVKALVAEKFLPEGLDYNTLLQISGTNLEALKSLYEANKKQLDISQSTQNAWSNFSRQLELAGQKLENVFVKALVSLAPALSKFSNALVSAVGTVMKSPFVKSLIEGAGKGLQKGADYLASGQFSTDFKEFLETMKTIGKGVADTASFLSRVFGTQETTIGQEARQLKALASGQSTRAFAPGEAARLTASIPITTNTNVNFTHKFVDAAGNNIPVQTFAVAH